MMNKQALEVQGIAVLRACRKMLKMFKVVRREKGINGPCDCIILPLPAYAYVTTGMTAGTCFKTVRI